MGLRRRCGETASRSRMASELTRAVRWDCDRWRIRGRHDLRLVADDQLALKGRDLNSLALQRQVGSCDPSKLSASRGRCLQCKSRPGGMGFRPFRRQGLGAANLALKRQAIQISPFQGGTSSFRGSKLRTGSKSRKHRNSRHPDRAPPQDSGTRVQYSVFDELTEESVSLGAAWLTATRLSGSELLAAFFQARPRW